MKTNYAYIPTTPAGMRKYLAGKEYKVKREGVWIVCIDEHDIPIACFIHLFGEESDNLILYNA